MALVRLVGRREPGLGPSLRPPKKPGLALVVLRWRHELVVAGAALSGFGTAVAWFGLMHAVLGAAGLAAAACGACARPRVRRLVAARFWVVATPHRVRTCFARSWIYNERGQIPAVIRARAMPFGEKVLLWVRAGVGFADIESATDILAAACFAADVIASRDAQYGHLVYLDVIRWPDRQVRAFEQEPAVSGASGDAGPNSQRSRLYRLPSDDQPDAA